MGQEQLNLDEEITVKKTRPTLTRKKKNARKSCDIQEVICEEIPPDYCYTDEIIDVTHL